MLQVIHCVHQAIGKNLSTVDIVVVWGEKEKLWWCTPLRHMEQVMYSSTHSITQHWLKVSGLLQTKAALPSKQQISVHID